jgi:hypothetical protein
VPQFDMGGKEMKYILQARNTTNPQSTKAATLIGSISKAGIHQKGKVDNYETIRQLLEEESTILPKSLVAQLKELEESHIVSFGGGGTSTDRHYCCLPKHAEIAPFIIIGGDGEGELCIPSRNLEGDKRGEAIELVKKSIGKWVPVQTDDVISHFVKLDHATTWRDVTKSQTFEHTTKSQLHVWNDHNCYAQITEYLSPEDQIAMMNTCVDFKRSRECSVMERKPDGYCYSIRLHTSDVKSLYPPLVVPEASAATDKAEYCSRVRLNELEHKVDGPVICVEGSDMMGLNLHRGMQGSGNMNCMCFDCNAQTKNNMNTKECIGSEKRTMENCQKWHRMYKHNHKCPAVERANTHKPPIYICKFVAPVPLHLVLGCVNTHRDWLGVICKEADDLIGGGGVDVAREIDRIEEEIDEVEQELSEGRDLSKQVKQFLPKAGFDPSDLVQMGRAASNCLESTLLGARIQKKFDSDNYEGEVVRYEGEETKDKGGWLVRYDDGDSETLNRNQITPLVTKHTYLGRNVEKEFDGDMCKGEVVEYDASGKTKDTPWLVLYDDGDREHMSRNEVEQHQISGQTEHGFRGRDAAAKLR